jgi:A/G-specific adenine glycosylase
MMDLGATLCTRTRPCCAGCPVNGDCVARRESRIAELPAPRPKKALPRRQVNVLIIEHAGRVLFERRPPTGVWPGLLGLPEVAIDEDVVRAVATRFGTTDATIEPLPPLTHVFTHFALEMRPSRVVAAAWPRGAAEVPLEWIAKEAIAGAALPSPVRRLLADLDEVTLWHQPS